METADAPGQGRSAYTASSAALALRGSFSSSSDSDARPIALKAYTTATRQILDEVDHGADAVVPQAANDETTGEVHLPATPLDSEVEDLGRAEEGRFILREPVWSVQYRSAEETEAWLVWFETMEKEKGKAFLALLVEHR